MKLTDSRFALVTALVTALTTTLAFTGSMNALAQTAGNPTDSIPRAVSAAASAPAWKFKAAHLGREQVDALLAQPDRLLVLDLRRPDELIKYGSFPVFLNVQNAELEKQLAYLPRDRVILTVSNHAIRAGAAADLLTAKGYRVAGAAGSEDYEREGGQAVKHLQPPPPRNGASAPRPQ